MGFAASFASKTSEEQTTNQVKEKIEPTVAQNNDNSAIEETMPENENIQAIENTSSNDLEEIMNQEMDEEFPTNPPAVVGGDVGNEYKSNYFSTKTERNVFLAFILPPIIISIISAIHLSDFFKVGNTETISIILSGAFELANLASLLGIVVLKGLLPKTRFFLWVVIAGLYFLQLFGNVFASFSFITSESAMSMYQFFGLQDSIFSKRIISYIIGGILTIVSFSLTKIASDYIRKSVK